MEQLLITGPTGNVGSAILRHFRPRPDQQVLLGMRQPNAADLQQRYVDFENMSATIEALDSVDVLFLLRPPHISGNRTFASLMEGAKSKGVKHIVFLSVQGAERTSFIPHAKIEKLIRNSGMAYTFVRPSYFMQNLTTTLREDIQQRDRIFLPAGRAKFLWVDVDDIGKAIAAVLSDVTKHAYQAYTITGSELADFYEVARILTETLQRKIDFASPGPWRFFVEKKQQGTPVSFILVMLALHFLPRFQSPPPISYDLSLLTGGKPQTLAAFMRAHATQWQPQAS